MDKRRKKIYVKIIDSCPDCPYCNWQIDKESDNPLACEHPNFTKYKRFWTGRDTSVHIPKWCPLPDSTSASGRKNVVNLERN